MNGFLKDHVPTFLLPLRCDAPDIEGERVPSVEEIKHL